MKKNALYLIPFMLLLFAACDKDNTNPPTSNAKVRFKFRFDENQVRLNNLAQPAVMPAGHAAQTPAFHGMSVHYIELDPEMFTALGAGAILYHAPETTQGGDNAIDFSQAIVSDEGTVFLEIPIKDINPGTYNWVRASVGYQNYDIKFNIRNVPIVGDLLNQNGTVASFLGFNTYIGNYQVGDNTVTVNDDKKQGYGGFDPNLSSPYNTYYNTPTTWQAPAGATTVVNPLFATSPIPAGSCIVTGSFSQPLVITGEETQDIDITLSFSVNHSFEWIDNDNNGTYDLYYDVPANSDVVIDMGVRGLIVEKQ